MILRQQTVTQTLTKTALNNLTHEQDDALDRFITLLALRKIEIARRDVRSSNPGRRRAGLEFLYSDFAELLCSGIGLSVECVRRRVDTQRFFIESPNLNDGRRFRSFMQPVVISGLIRPLEDSNVYRIIIQEPETFAENYHTVTSADWIEVSGPARWLTEMEYVQLLEKFCMDKRLIAVARITVKETNGSGQDIR